MDIEKMIGVHVDQAIAHTFRLELANPSNGQPMTLDERRAFLTRAFIEIAKGIGFDRFMQTPSERLDQFAVMSALKNHDTAGLLLSLVNSFMIAYACPETSDRAFAALTQIEGMRAEVADFKGQGRMSNKPELVAAATGLDVHLSVTNDPVVTPYKVLVGADRLYVKSSGGLNNLPQFFAGFAVEAIVGNTN